MAFELTNAPQIRASASVKYDTEKVLLIGTFFDELSAYRARRVWLNTLAQYFTLEDKRDYDLSLSRSDQERDKIAYVVTCSFHSACGRYAFWRLINGQSPEAERTLGLQRSKKKTQQDKLLSAVFGYENRRATPSWVINTSTRRSRRFTKLLRAAMQRLSCLLF